MNPDKSISVIVPCYNEGQIIRDTMSGLLDKGYQVIVVDDASSDNTRSALSQLPVHYIRHSVNLGQGAALQTGLTAALKTGATVFVTFDADGQHDVDDIGKMIKVLKDRKLGIVFGSRFLKGAETNILPGRKLLLKAGRLVNFFISGMLLSDANNGIRVFTRETACKLVITENRSSHSAQIQSLVRKHGIRYTEHPVHISYSVYSRQKGLKNINGIRILYDLILYKIFR